MDTSIKRGGLLFMELLEILKGFRHHYALTKKEMSEILGISQNSYYYYENGMIPKSEKKLIDIIQKLGVSPAIFSKEDNDFNIVITYKQLKKQINKLTCNKKVEIITYQKDKGKYKLTTDSFPKEKCLLNEVKIFFHNVKKANIFISEKKLNIKKLSEEKIYVFVEIIPKFEEFETKSMLSLPKIKKQKTPYFAYNLKKSCMATNNDEVAERMLCSKRSLSNYLSETTAPSRTRVVEFCDLLGISSLSSLGLALIENKTKKLSEMLSLIKNNCQGSVNIKIALYTRNGILKEKIYDVSQMVNCDNKNIADQIWVMNYDVVTHNNKAIIVLFISAEQYLFVRKSVDDRKGIVASNEQFQKTLNNIKYEYNFLEGHKSLFLCSNSVFSL